MWFALEAAPDGNAFWIAEYFDIGGPIDAPVLEAAVRRTLIEAESLHAVLASSPAGPVQRRGCLHAGWRLVALDFSGQDDPEAAAHAWMRGDVRVPGGLGETRFRQALLKLSPDRFFFYQRNHHLLTDGFTGWLLANRTAALYSRAVDPEAPVRRGSRRFGRFGTFLAADRAYEGSEDQDRDRRFWLARMDGWRGPVRLAGRAAPATEQSLVQWLSLDRELPSRLKAVAAANGVSFADFVIALVAIWTNAHDGADDLALGLALLGRPAGADRAPVPAIATNILPVRLGVRADLTAIDLARAAASFRQQARSHVRYRGERLIAELTGGDARSFGPTVNIMSFSYAPRFGAHQAVVRTVSIGPVQDICVTIHDRRDGGPVEISLNANPTVYSPDRLETLATRFARLLRLAADQPLTRVGHIDLLDPAERARLLHDRNRTARAIPFIGLPALFESQVAAAPDAPCLVMDDAVLTYAMVNDEANRLGGHLTAEGVGRGDIVAILLPRGAEVLILALATMKARAAFLLIDPALPPERVAAIVNDAKPRLVATRRSFAGSIPPAALALILDETEPRGEVPREAGAAELVPDDLAPDDLAYVIFTSGTSGRPKAVAVPHRGLASLAVSLTEAMGTARSSRVLQFSALGFDAVVLELCMAFAVGASLHPPGEDERHGPPLGRFLDRRGITHALLPPAALAGLRAETQRAPAALMVGGEACPVALAASWSAGRLLVNAYGPAESTVVATMSGALTGDGAPPIGRPILNTRVYILDAFGRLAPDGVAGELYVAGDGLAAGYLGRKGLTAERFLACPFEPSGARMYRTGDRARWLPDGSLAFLGRVDRQVKLRGFRVEPAEIEAALGELPGVAEACVIPRGEGVDLLLAAYVVAAEGVVLEPETLRRELGARLPRYMVPQAITILPALPLTPNGKVDVAALPVVARAPSGEALPETPAERALAPLFAAVLGRPDIGIDDNFFSLGGDSLKAALLIARIGETLGFEPTIASLFNAPTVRALALALARPPDPAEAVSPFAVLLPLRGGVGPGLFCLHPGPGLGWPYSALIRHLPGTMPLFAVQARGLMGAEPLPSTLAGMAADYADRIRARQPTGPYHLLGWSSGGPLAHAVAIALQAGGGEVGLVASLDGYPADPGYAAATPAGVDPMAEREVLRGTIDRYLAAANTADDGVPAVPLDDDLLSAMLRVFANTGRILSRDRPNLFRGDLLLIKSTEAYDIPLPGAEAWRPFVTGRVDLVEIPCHHDTMLLPGPAETIGPIIAERLRAWSPDAAMPAAPVAAEVGIPPAGETGIDAEAEHRDEAEAADTGPRLSILMTNIVLSGRSGTEIMTAELARSLHARGHRVAIYTTEPGPLAREMMARGIPVTNRIDRIGFTPDIIHGHHNAALAAAMIRFPGTPAIFVCHDTALAFDAPIVCDRIGAYVAIDGACVDRMVVAGVAESRIVAIPNGIDLARFQLRRHWNERPKTALAIVKGDAPQLDRVREACRLEGLALEVVGLNVGRVVTNLPEFCAQADIVLAHSRGALEAAVTGAAVIICDEYGFGGLLGPAELEQWPNTRLAHRSLDEPVTVSALRQAIRQYRREDVMRFARMLRGRVSLARITGDYLRLYRKVLADRRDAARPPDDGPIAAFVADFLPKLNEHERRSKLEAAADQRRRELDDWLALNARGEGADAEITFNAGTLGRLLLDDGWHAAEDWCVWSGDAVAYLRLPAALLARSRGDVTVRCTYYFPRNGPDDGMRTVGVFAGGEKIAVWEFPRAEVVGNRIHARALRIPEALMGNGAALRLAFHADRTVSPLEAGEGDDSRQLGLALVSIAAATIAE